MKKQRENDLIDLLAEGYEQMLERAVKDARQRELKTERRLHQLIHDARDKAVELGELTQNEADRVAKYLARDLSDVKVFLNETGKEIKDWLGFETSLLESEIGNLLLEVADDTTVDLILLKAMSQDEEHYLINQISGPGTLICDGCGEKLKLRRTTKLSACQKCGSDSFHRR